MFAPCNRVRSRESWPISHRRLSAGIIAAHVTRGNPRHLDEKREEGGGGGKGGDGNCPECAGSGTHAPPRAYSIQVSRKAARQVAFHSRPPIAILPTRARAPLSACTEGEYREKKRGRSRAGQEYLRHVLLGFFFFFTTEGKLQHL